MYPLAIVILCLIYSFGKINANIVTITSFECREGERLCPNLTCAITTSHNRQTFATVGCYLPFPMFNVTAHLQMQRKRGRQYETMFSARENMCEVVMHMTRTNFMSRVFANVHKYVKNFKCPFQGNMTANNLPLSLSFVPGFIPRTQYRVKVDVRNAEELILAVDVGFNIGKQNKDRNKN